ncbi:MAG: OmpA family protein [Paracoccaceae bacterium]
MKFLTNNGLKRALICSMAGFALFAPLSAHAQAVSADDIAAALERQRAALLDGSRGSAACVSGDCRGIQLYDPSSTTIAEPKKVITAAPSSSSANAGTKVVSQPSKKTTAKASSGYKSNTARAVPVALPNLPKGERLDLVILFEFDSAFIRPASRSQLQALCDAIGKMRAADKFAIIGHTDASGDARYNFNLSKRRAKEVRRHLISECGVSGDRLEAFGFGEERLLNGIAGRSEKQRRVEIQLNLSS